jgi:hypothetical protein
VLGEKAYVVIPDISPLGQRIQNEGIVFGNSAKNYFNRLAEKNNPTISKQLAVQEGNENNVEEAKNKLQGDSIFQMQNAIPSPDLFVSSVMKGFKSVREAFNQIGVNKDGLISSGNIYGNETLSQQKSSDRSLALAETPVPEPQKPATPINFIIASEIKDLKKAKEVLTKMKQDKKYGIAENNYLGYAYYKVSAPEADKKNESDPYFNYTDTFHALLGTNWVMASSEADLKNMIAKEDKENSLGNILSKKAEASLVTDSNYQKISQSLNKKDEEGLYFAYLKINYEKFFKPEKECDTCASATDFMKYPNDIIFGLSVKVTADGIFVKYDSNKMNSADLKNKKRESSLAYKMPQKINGKWADVFLESNNLKEQYYNFKKNNLTDKGFNELNSVIRELKGAMGFDLETDFIDLIGESSVFSMFTNTATDPEGALIFEITDSSKMLDTMKKIVEFIKNMNLVTYQSQISWMDKAINPVAPAESSMKTIPKMQLNPQESESYKKKIDLYKSYVDKIKQSQLIETETANGKIYSYKLPATEADPTSLMMGFAPGFSGGDGFSFDFSLENNQFILGTNYATVESLARELKNNTEKKLSDNEFYKKATSYFPAEIYSNSYVNSQGIYNVVDYIYRQMTLGIQESKKQYCSGENVNASYCANSNVSNNDSSDEFFAYLAVLRTIKTLATYSSINGDFDESSTFINIQELPKDEKDRAENIINNTSSNAVSPAF